MGLWVKSNMLVSIGQVNVLLSFDIGAFSTLVLEAVRSNSNDNYFFGFIATDKLP